MAGKKEVSVLVKAIDQLTGPLQSMSKQTKGFVDGVKGIFQGLVAGLAALGLVKFFKDSIDQAAEAEVGWGRLATAVRNIGGNFAQLRPEIDNAVKSIQQMTTATDDELREALTQMITISGDYQGSLANLQLVADVAAFKNISLSAAAEMVGKAMTGQERVFKQFGITAGDNASKMEQLRGTVAGFAEQQGGTFTGLLTRIKNGWGEVQEATGQAIVEHEGLRGQMGGLIGSLANLEEWIGKNSDGISKFIGGLTAFASFVGGVLKGAFNLIDDAVTSVAEKWLVFRMTVQEVWAHLKDALGGMLQTIGEFAMGAKGVLKKLGIDIGPGIAEDLAKAGAKMRGQAAQDLRELQNEYKVKLADLRGEVAEHEDKHTEVVKKGGGRRTKLTKEELEAQEKARKEALKAREEYEKKITALEDKLLTALLDSADKASKEYLEAWRKWMRDAEETYGAAAAAHEGDSLRVQRALEGVRQKLTQLSSEYARAKLPVQQLSGVKEQIAGVMTTRVTPAFEIMTDAEVRSTIETGKSKEQWEKFKKEVSEAGFALADGMDAMVALAQAAGISSPELEQFAAGIANIGEGIGRIASGDILGGITSGLSGITSLANMFFGESASARFVRLALEKHRETLEKHRSTLGDLIAISSPGAKVAAAQGGLGAFAGMSTADLQRAGLVGLTTPQLVNEQALAKFLLGRGTSLADIEDLAKQLGVQLRDDKGRLNTRLLQSFSDILGELDTGRPTDFAGQLDTIKRLNQFRGGSKEDLLKQVFDLAMGSSPFLADRLSGIDVTTAEGRQALLAAIPDIFENMGAVGPAGLGRMSQREFESILELFHSLLGDIGSEEGTTPEGEAPGKEAPAPGRRSPTGAPPPVEIPEDSFAGDLLGSMNDHLASIDEGIGQLVAMAGSAIAPAGVGEAFFGAGGAARVAVPRPPSPGASGALTQIGPIEKLIIYADSQDTVDSLKAKILEAARTHWAQELEFNRRARGTS